MVENSEKSAKEISKQTSRDPVVLAAAGSVLLAWFQFYVRGNREHGQFIGLWAPTLLALSNSVRIKDLSRKAESKTANLYDLVANR